MNAGSLINNGGLGNAGTAFIGGELTVTATDDSINKDIGAIHTDGGLGVTKAANIGLTLDVVGITTIADATTSSSTTTGTCRARHSHPPVSDCWGAGCLDGWQRWIGNIVLYKTAVWLGSGQNRKVTTGLVLRSVC